MLKFLLGVVLGICIATVGFSGFARWADKGVSEIQKATKEVVK